MIAKIPNAAAKLQKAAAGDLQLGEVSQQRVSCRIKYDRMTGRYQCTNVVYAY